MKTGEQVVQRVIHNVSGHGTLLRDADHLGLLARNVDYDGLVIVFVAPVEDFTICCKVYNLKHILGSVEVLRLQTHALACFVFVAEIHLLETRPRLRTPLLYDQTVVDFALFLGVAVVLPLVRVLNAVLHAHVQRVKVRAICADRPQLTKNSVAALVCLLTERG